MTRNLNYSQGHSLINHCDRRITHLSDTDISFVLFDIYILKISFVFRVFLAITQNAQEIKQSKRYISITLEE